MAARVTHLKTTTLSHGTLESLDLSKSRRFYEEVLGLTVRQNSPLSLSIRLGDDHPHAVVAAPNSTPNMPASLRNTLTFAGIEQVDDAHREVSAVASEYGVRALHAPQRHRDRYSFLVQDLDGNWWELACLDNGGQHHYFD